MYGSAPATACSLNSLTTSSISGSVSTGLSDPTADVTHPAFIVFHMPDSSATGPGLVSFCLNPNAPFTFQYELPGE